MKLTKKQRKIIRGKIKSAPLHQVAQELNLKPKEIEAYLKKIWRKEKYEKLVNEKKRSSLPQPISKPKAWLKNNRRVLFFLACLVLIVYFNSLNNDFVSDDIGAIAQNPNLPRLGYAFSNPLGFPRPLIHFFVYQLTGLKPILYRLINIFFHLGSSWLIYFLLGFFFNSPLPLMAAAIFAVHPALIESVAWISGAPYSNSALFIFLSFLGYLQAKKGRWPYFLSPLVFLFGLFFSEKIIVFPLVILLYEILFGQPKKEWSKIAPFFVISGFWMLHLLSLLAPRMDSLAVNYSQASVGFFNPLIQIPAAISGYLELIFWPKNLTLYHSEMSFTPFEYFLRVAGLSFFLISLAYFLKKEKRIFFWLSFFVISLLPTLTPLKIASIVAERYLYLGSIGLIVLATFLIEKVGQKVNQKVAWALFGIILLGLSTRTVIRNNDWQNQDTLWLATAKVSPSSHQNHNNLGDLYGRQGNLEKAVQEFQKAIELNPNYADAFHNLANTYWQMGKIELAVENYQKALEANPTLWQSHQNLAAIYYNQKRLDLAVQELERAVSINPQDPNLMTNLGVAYLEANQREKAKQAFQRALQLDPYHPKAKELLISL